MLGAKPPVILSKIYKLRLFIKNMDLQVLVGFSMVPNNY